MSGRQDEPVAVQPSRVGRVVAERVPVEHGADIGAAQRQTKVAALAGRPLLVDTGSEETNAMLCGYVRVVTGYDEQLVVRVTA